MSSWGSRRRQIISVSTEQTYEDDGGGWFLSHPMLIVQIGRLKVFVSRLGSKAQGRQPRPPRGKVTFRDRIARTNKYRNDNGWLVYLLGLFEISVDWHEFNYADDDPGFRDPTKEG